MESEEQIAEHIRNKFKDLYTSNGELPAKAHVTINDRVPAELKAELEEDFTADDIKEALGHMKPWKVLGPDSLHAGFYQTYWGIVE